MVNCQKIPQQCKPDCKVFRNKKGSDFELAYSNTYSISYDASSYLANNGFNDGVIEGSGIYLITSVAESWNLKTCSNICICPEEERVLDPSCILNYDLHCRLVGYVDVSLVISLSTITPGNNRFTVQSEVDTVNIRVPYTCNEFYGKITKVKGGDSLQIASSCLPSVIYPNLKDPTITSTIVASHNPTLITDVNFLCGLPCALQILSFITLNNLNSLSDLNLGISTSFVTPIIRNTIESLIGATPATFSLNQDSKNSSQWTGWVNSTTNSVGVTTPNPVYPFPSPSDDTTDLMSSNDTTRAFIFTTRMFGTALLILCNLK